MYPEHGVSGVPDVLSVFKSLSKSTSTLYMYSVHVCQYHTTIQIPNIMYSNSQTPSKYSSGKKKHILS